MGDEPASPLPYEVVAEDDDGLIGYEPRTVPFDPGDAEQVRQLESALRDACRAGQQVRVVRDDAGFLTLWQQASSFWRFGG